MTRFSRFAAIDWSGAVGPRQPGIAIAVCGAGDAAPVLVRHGQIWSRVEALAWTLEAAAVKDTLIGFDLSPAFPFADRGAYFSGWDRSPPDARALWALVEEVCADDPHLSAASFVRHPEAGRHFRHAVGAGDRFGGGRGRLRVVEHAMLDRRVASPSSTFNLVGAAQVGKASLTGMRLLHGLDGRVAIWPFDPLPASGSVIVEIYTALAALAAGVPKGRAKLRTAAALDAALHALGSRPHAPLAAYDDHRTDALLAAWLRAAPADFGAPDIARIEGWTYGVQTP